MEAAVAGAAGGACAHNVGMAASRIDAETARTDGPDFLNELDLGNELLPSR